MLQMATLQLHAWTLGVPGADGGILALCLDTGHFKLNVGISALRLQHLSQRGNSGSAAQHGAFLELDNGIAFLCPNSGLSGAKYWNYGSVP